MVGEKSPHDRGIPRPIPNSRRILKKLPALIGQVRQEQAVKGKAVRIMFQDEARFGRISDNKRCWAPKGVRPEVPHQIIREYVYAFSAICPADGLLVSLILPFVNAWTMSLFLEEVSQRFPDEYILVFMDRTRATSPR